MFVCELAPPPTTTTTFDDDDTSIDHTVVDDSATQRDDKVFYMHALILSVFEKSSRTVFSAVDVTAQLFVSNYFRLCSLILIVKHLEDLGSSLRPAYDDSNKRADKALADAHRSRRLVAPLKFKKGVVSWKIQSQLC